MVILKKQQLRPTRKRITITIDLNLQWLRSINALVIPPHVHATFVNPRWVKWLETAKIIEKPIMIAKATEETALRKFA